MIEHLQKLAPEIVERFLETREAQPLGIPEPLANYILQLNEAANLHRRYHSISECARQLQKKYPDLSIHTCKSRIYDSINYLNADSNVTTEAWENYFADMYMKLFEVCLVAHDFRQAGKWLLESKKCRINASASAIDPERLQFKHQIVSADFEIARMFIKGKKGFLNAKREAYKIIEGLEINDTEKNRLFGEVDSEIFTEYEEI